MIAKWKPLRRFNINTCPSDRPAGLAGILFHLQRILETPDGILDLALDFVGRALRLQFAISNGLANDLPSRLEDIATQFQSIELCK